MQLWAYSERRYNVSQYARNSCWLAMLMMPKSKRKYNNSSMVVNVLVQLISTGGQQSNHIL
jgi:hypothetical protein